MKRILTMASLLALVAACVPAGAPVQRVPASPQSGIGQTGVPPRLSTDAAARNFVSAVARVQPLAERICRERTRNTPCDFRIIVDNDPSKGVNAYQTVGDNGEPILGFTLPLIAEARNQDEIAFVIGHEAAHHILGHIPQTQRNAGTGAILAGILVAAGGGDAGAIQNAQQIGATLGARGYSQRYELQADYLGVEITERAGFDALRGAEFFNRIPDPGDSFLGSHPPNAERMNTVRAAVNARR